MTRKGYLVLENGNVYEGNSFGFSEDISGEVVFNTGMVGYPESFTDPSYRGQILTLTYPLIGNYGVPKFEKKNGLVKTFESDNIHIRGLIVSSYIEDNNHWESARNLSSWLTEEKIPALCGIDTRSLTKTLRESGVMKGKITFEKPRQTSGFVFEDINKINLVAQVSCSQPVTYGTGKLKIALLDCGFKYNQIRNLLRFDTTVYRFPWNYNIFGKDNSLSDFDAVFISNGPGDPKTVRETIDTVKETLKREIPTLGICLGNQILALAGGADTYKLKYGHRSQNQPVKDEQTNRCYITTQNHGFAVNTGSLPQGWQPWFTNLNDKTNEGIKHCRLPFFSSQFHPEASPGPVDTEWIFGYFIDQIKKWKKIN